MWYSKYYRNTICSIGGIMSKNILKMEDLKVGEEYLSWFVPKNGIKFKIDGYNDLQKYIEGLNKWEVCLKSNSWFKDARFVKIEKGILDIIYEEEYVILILIRNNLNYLARDNNNELYAFINKPLKEIGAWMSDKDDYIYSMDMFDVNFDWVKVDDIKPTKIKDVIKEYEDAKSLLEFKDALNKI